MKRVVIWSSLAALILSWLAVTFLVPWHERERITHVNAAALLSACDYMRSHCASMRNDWDGNPTLAVGERVLDSRKHGIDASVPDDIRELKPSYIMVSPNRVVIAFGRRTGCLVGFAEGVPVYGTKKLADRLWYWVGNR